MEVFSRIHGTVDNPLMPLMRDCALRAITTHNDESVDNDPRRCLAYDQIDGRWVDVERVRRTPPTARVAPTSDPTLGARVGCC